VTIIAEKKRRLEIIKQEEIASRNYRDDFVREQDKALFDFDEDINDLEDVEEKYQDIKNNGKQLTEMIEKNKK
jgi:hypothetical protein